MRAKAFGQRGSQTKGRQGLSPLQKVSVALCDQRQTPFLTGRPRVATQEFVQLGQVLGLRRRRKRGMKRAGATLKGQHRPVRPTTVGGRQTPFLTKRPLEATGEFVQPGEAFGRALEP